MSPAEAPLASVDDRLRQVDTILSAHLDNTPLAVIEWAHGTHIARWSGQAQSMFGWSADEVLGKCVEDWRFVYEDDFHDVSARVRQMSSGRERRCVVLNRNYTKDGRVIWCQWHNSLLVDDASGEHSVLSLVMEVTERKVAEEELRRSEARFRAALASAQMLGWDWDLRERRSYYSGDYAEFYGLPAGPDYGDGENGWLAVHPDDRPTIAAALQNATERGDDLNFEYRGAVPRTDGQTRWFITRGQVLRALDGCPTRVVAVTTDITEHKRADCERAALDRQLLDAQKWESLGVLAGGVAHDFNNILTVIMGAAGLARKLLPLNSPAGPLLDQIDDASRRAADLSRQMLAYSGRSLTTSTRNDLNRLIRDVEPLLGIPAGRHARLHFDLASELPPIKADAAQVRQVLVNLVMNAAEALAPAGGNIILRTRVDSLSDSSPIPLRLAPPGGTYVVLDVADSGPGMTDDVKARMFDPFFTTRFPGRGLGLSAVLGIVRAHGGGLAVASQPGQGTTVRIAWPIAETAPRVEALSDSILPPINAHPVAALKPASAAATHCRGLALLIGDELFIRELTATMLEDLGYEPLLAADCESGLTLLREQAARITLIVVDLSLPGRMGTPTVARIRSEAVHLPIVVMSGIAERIDLDKRMAILQKPFRAEALTAAIRAAAGD